MASTRWCASPHGEENLTLLHEVMEDRVISKGAAVSWPPQSPDLTPPDFFLWGHIKSQVYKSSPKDKTELKEAIRSAINAISKETCVRVVGETNRRLILCAARNGGHVENA